MRPRPSAPAALCAALLLAACSAGTGTPRPSTAADPDDLVVAVRHEGGFAPPEARFGDFPQVAVLADGRVYAPGVEPAIYPGPLLPAVAVGRLDAAVLAGLLDLAIRNGLASGEDATWPATSVMDAPATVILVRADGVTTETSFGGLGSDLPDGKSAGELAARRGASEVVAALEQAAMGSAEQAAYRPAAVRLLARPYVTQPDLPQAPVAWPLPSDLASGGSPWPAAETAIGRCLVVGGADLDLLWPVLERANDLTPFEADGRQFLVAVRPLLPSDEPACP